MIDAPARKHKVSADQMWAAVNSSNYETVSMTQVRRALVWLTALCENNMRPVERRCRKRAAYYTLVAFDGSLTGGGATLQVGLQDIQQAAQSLY